MSSQETRRFDISRVYDGSFFCVRNSHVEYLPHGFYMFGDFVWRGKRLLFLIMSVFGKDFFLCTYGEERMTSQEKCLFLCVLPPFPPPANLSVWLEEPSGHGGKY